MKYTIELREDNYLNNSEGDECNEVTMILQIWQDLHRISKKDVLHQEDALIKKVLEQILEKEFNGVGNIPVPEYYTYHERHKED